MKRIIAFVLVVIMLVPGLVACKNDVPPIASETEPMGTEPPATEPPATEPPVTEPPVTEHPVTEPPVTEPPATEPPVTEPPVTEPPVTEPPVTEPPVTEPPATEPPVTEPPATEPPVTEPPVTEPPVTEPPVTEPPVTEPPVTEPPVTEPPVTEPPVTEPTEPIVETGYKIYDKWKAPSSYFEKTENDYVSAVVSNNLNSVFITARKSGELCWYFAVSDNEIPSSNPFPSISTAIVTPQVKYKHFKDGFEKIKYEKNSIAIESGQTVEINLNGYQAVVIAIKEKNNKYSEWLTVRNPGLTLELGANMDTDGMRYSDTALEKIVQNRYFKFQAEADGVVYVRVFSDPNVLRTVRKISAFVGGATPYLPNYWFGRGKQLTCDFNNVRKGGDHTISLEYTVEFYSALLGTEHIVKTGMSYPVDKEALWIARDIGEEKRREILESLYLCIQLVDGENFYKPIVIKFDEFMK